LLLFFGDLDFDDFPVLNVLGAFLQMRFHRFDLSRLIHLCSPILTMMLAKIPCSVVC